MKCAYATVLYGNNESFLYALLMAITLNWVKTSHEVILLYSDDVPQHHLNLLESVYDRLIKVDDIPVTEKLFSPNVHSRFLRVFNKIHCLKLVDYDLILVCDSDISFLKNCDELFDLTAPAAVILDNTFRLEHNRKGDAVEASRRSSRGMSYINAGVMLLRPDLQDFEKICSEVTGDWEGKAKYTHPEQTFLSGFYADQWHSIHQRFNCMPLYLLSKSYRALALKLRIDELAVLHVGGSVKPLHYLLQPSDVDPEEGKEFHEAVRSKLKSWNDGEALVFSMSSAAEYYASLNMLWIVDFMEMVDQLGIQDYTSLCNSSVAWVKEEVQIGQKKLLHKGNKLKRSLFSRDSNTRVFKIP